MHERKKEQKQNFHIRFSRLCEGLINSGNIFYIRIAKGFHIPYVQDAILNLSNPYLLDTGMFVECMRTAATQDKGFQLPSPGTQTGDSTACTILKWAAANVLATQHTPKSLVKRTETCFKKLQRQNVDCFVLLFYISRVLEASEQLHTN